MGSCYLRHTSKGESPHVAEKSATSAMKSFRINGVDGRAKIGLAEKDDVTEYIFCAFNHQPYVALG
jgi:hypothetical protein